MLFRLHNSLQGRVLARTRTPEEPHVSTMAISFELFGELSREASAEAKSKLVEAGEVGVRLAREDKDDDGRSSWLQYDPRQDPQEQTFRGSSQVGSRLRITA